MIRQLCGLALDARCAANTGDAFELAHASRWIAANALAIRHRAIVLAGELPDRACVFAPRVGGLGGLFAALAAIPSLVDATSLPRRWRVALRALGLPFLDRPAALAIAGRASVVTLDPHVPWVIDVVEQPRAYVVSVARQHHALAA